MATDKRERQRANRALKQEQEEKSDKKEQVRQRGFTIALAVIGVAAVLGLLWFATRGDDSSTDTADAAAASTTSTTAFEAAVVVPAPGGTIEGTTECPAADGSSERITQFAEAPPMCIDASKSYTALMSTNMGDITIELDAVKAPNTVNNFVTLARYHYYDGTPFHRIVSDFVIQGGDAVGPRLGVGNPGYLIDEEAPEEGEYEIGSLAMAKGQGDTSTGSQFFIITGENGASLPAQYSLFGKVSEGLDVVEAIEAIPTIVAPGSNEPSFPTEEIYVESVTITES